MSKKKKNVVKEPTLGLYDLESITANESKISDRKKNKKFNKYSEAFLRSRFLANSIGLYTFFLKSTGNNNGKILPFIYLSLITAAELRIHNKNLEEFYASYNKKVNDYFEGNIKNLKNWGIAFFIYLISENSQKYGITQNLTNEFRYLKKAVELIWEVRNGKKTTRAILEFIKYFPEEQNAVIELKEFMKNIDENDPFLPLPELNKSLFKIINGEKLNEQYLKTWVRIMNILGTVLENSAKDPKDTVMDTILSDNNKITSELDVLLFGLFLIRLYHGVPYDKVIPLAFIDHEAMNFVAPLSEAFVNPKFIIEGAKKEKIDLDKYFWIYVRNNPKSIFEDITVEEIEIVQKIKRKKFGEIISFDF